MYCTLLIPHLIWPREASHAIARDLDLPALAKLLARASVERHPPVALESWLCQAFAVERQQDWPIAPFTLASDYGAPQEGYWLRADPVHLKLSRDRLVLVDATLFDVGAEEADALLESLNRYFTGEGLVFHGPAPKRWYAKAADTPQLVTHAISEVAGKGVEPYLPSGEDAPRWRRILNETQMLLHEHPVNEVREARGEPPVNSVWFWGGGTQAHVPEHPFHRVWSDNDIALALAHASGAPTGGTPVDTTAWLDSVSSPVGRRDSHLIVLEDLAAAAAYHDSDAWRVRITALEARWFSPLTSALREGRITSLTLAALGEDSFARFVVNRADLLKLWRRPRPMAAYS